MECGVQIAPSRCGCGSCESTIVGSNAEVGQTIFTRSESQRQPYIVFSKIRLPCSG
jgi:hypothetical protein